MVPTPQLELRFGTPDEAGMASERVRRIVDLGKSWVEDGRAPALVLMAARHGVIFLHEAFGKNAPEAEAAATRLDTLFPMSSISKVVTATCLMLLVEDGLVGVNRPVQSYLPDVFVGEDKETVTLHHLLTHTSGWEDEAVEALVDGRKGSVPIPPADATQHPAVQEMLFLGRDAPLTRPPGERMSYCSHGYNLLGEVVRRVSGRALDDFARERIFDPLGMGDSYFVVPDEALARVVRRRPLDPPPFGLDSPEYHQTPWAEAGLVSTARDMVVFAQMFLNGGSYAGRRVLSGATVAAMTRNQTSGISAEYMGEHIPEAGWSYGWGLQLHKHTAKDPTLSSPASFGHGGSGGVFLWGDPEHGIAGAYISVARPSPTPSDRFHNDAAVDLFVNAVTAAIRE